MADTTNQGACFAELHNRPFPLLSGPMTVSQLAFHDPGSLEDERSHIAVLAQCYGVSPPAVGASCYYQHMGEFEFRWERHTEFSSYIILMPVEGDRAFDCAAASVLPLGWLEGIAGTLLARDHIDLRPAPERAIPAAQLHPLFEGHRLLGSRLRGGQSTLYTALREHADGYCRTLVLNHREDPVRVGAWCAICWSSPPIAI